MIWAGLTDHLLCKTELFLDARFSVLRFWYLQIILYIIISLEKVENKSLKSFQPELNLTKTCFLFHPGAKRTSLSVYNFIRFTWDIHWTVLSQNLIVWSKILITVRTVKFKFWTILRFNATFLATGLFHLRVSSSFDHWLFSFCVLVFDLRTFQFNWPFKSSLMDRILSVRFDRVF